ncbi:MAG: hypothetical protein A2Y10_06135 [Planctomycetes bacterium GWF2_41_51]|nr:MAG: hypothetical protein A2Y10_06135 [Planctomycetes bacterium GWF2_41_51]HBG26465.1 hypothetical protein [Phycisphaerales bacterium]
MKTRLLLFAVVTMLLLGSTMSVNAITYTTIGFKAIDTDGTNVIGEYSGGKFLYNMNTHAWTTLDLPGTLTGISGSNIVGTYWDDTLHANRGFIYDSLGWITLNFPGASNTSISGVDGDNIVGTADGHSVIYNLNSQIWNTFDVSGALFTTVLDIDNGNIIGYYKESDEISSKGFFYDGTDFYDLPVTPYAISGRNVVVLYAGIYNLDSQSMILTNNAFGFSGQIIGISGDTVVGWYKDNALHGFIATIPEPATLLLLSLGAAFLRKKESV